MKTHSVSRRSAGARIRPMPNPKRASGRTFHIRTWLTIPESHLDDAIEMVRAWYGVHLRRAQVLTMARHNSSLAKDLADLPTDTETREAIACEVAKLVTGKPWPTFGDGPRAWTRFAKSFNELAAKKGIRLERMLDVKPRPARPRRMSRCNNAVPALPPQADRQKRGTA
jgi:hypothetical protein